MEAMSRERAIFVADFELTQSTHTLHCSPTYTSCSLDCRRVDSMIYSPLNLYFS